MIKHLGKIYLCDDYNTNKYLCKFYNKKHLKELLNIYLSIFDKTCDDVTYCGSSKEIIVRYDKPELLKVVFE